MKKYRNLILLNLGIVLCATVCYSPGLLGLRPSDESIFRAGMSIIVALVAVFLLVFGNYTILKEPERKRVSKNTVSDLDKAEAVLKTYFEGKYCGKMAKTASEQLSRMLKSFSKAEVIINEKFGIDSLSGSKYYSSIELAKDAALNNIVVMANRMQMFDEKQYQRLSEYKNDEIPDDIQEQQLALYESSLEKIKSSIVLNERILLNVDNLLMELSASDGSDSQTDDLLQEIETLTEEAQYYK